MFTTQKKRSYVGIGRGRREWEMEEIIALSPFPLVKLWHKYTWAARSTH